MIRGFYSAASALVAGLFRQELISHNLANIDVAGFKELTTGLDEFERRPYERLTAELPGGAPSIEVGATSLGVVTRGAVTDFAIGSLRQTSQPFDLAIAGDGFFRVSTPDGERYTRDGRFTRDENGHLATVERYLLLDTNGQPLVVPEGDAVITPDGRVTVNGQAAGQVGVFTFANPKTDLTRDGQNLFTATVMPTAANAAANLRQGYLEMSNVDPARTMAQMMAVSRAYEAAQRTMQMQDEMLGKAVNEIGQV